MAKREVKVYEWKRADGPSQFEKKYIGTGSFHQWGADYEEFDSGPGNFSTAIVEMPDGSVKNVPVELIIFVVKNKAH
jgi:hypothetical protein